MARVVVLLRELHFKVLFFGRLLLFDVVVVVGVVVDVVHHLLDFLFLALEFLESVGPLDLLLERVCSFDLLL